LNQISTQIRNKIRNLQNPPKEECAKRPKVLCRLKLGYGLASGFHEILWCLIYAYYNNKLMFLSMEWSFYFRGTNDEKNSNHESRESFLRPLSSTCDYKSFKNETLEEVPMNNNVFDRKLVNQLPKEFGSDIIKLVDSPNSWFDSQFSGYILRPQPRLSNYLNDFKRKINYRHPIVGVQVRRTDKLSGEAVFHRNSDYMIHVKDFYDKLELTEKVEQRLVYIASDDPSVLPQLIAEYPEYKFIGDIDGSKSAEKQETIYTNSSLWGALTDIYLLSETDYIVCTFSSAVSSSVLFLFLKLFRKLLLRDFNK
jgi:glycoprotein 6-alpha-L-fucosyltransferase